MSRDLLYRVPPLRGLTRGTGAGNGSFLLAKAAAKRVCPPLEQTPIAAITGHAMGRRKEGVGTLGADTPPSAGKGRYVCECPRGGQDSKRLVRTGSKRRPHLQRLQRGNKGSWRGGGKQGGEHFVVSLTHRAALPHLIPQRLQYQSDGVRVLAGNTLGDPQHP